MLLCAGISEKGPTKSVNQDAYLVKRAQTPAGDVCLALVADGMGGLQQGEVASAAIARAFDGWFERNLPLAGESLGFTGEAFSRAVRVQWLSLLQEVNLSLIKRGLRAGISLGAACTVFLVAAGAYYVMQVGDTRLYCVEDSAHACDDYPPSTVPRKTQRVVQLTRDQTFVEQELAAGRLSEEEAARHPLRGALLQCVGASHDLKPVFEQGIFDSNAAYVLASDGLYRALTDEEMARVLSGEALRAAVASVSASCSAAAVAEGGDIDDADASADAAGTGAADAAVAGAGAVAASAAATAAVRGSIPLAHPTSLQAHLRDIVDVSFARGGHDDATVVVVAASHNNSAPSRSLSDVFQQRSLCDQGVSLC